MALPTLLTPGGYDVDPRDLYGVALILHPGDATYEIEVQRAPDLAGAPDTANATTVAERLPPTVPFFVDFLPDDGVVRWYRMRHTSPLGEDPGDWTDWQAATPEPVTPELLTTNDAARAVETVFDEDGILGEHVRQRSGTSVRRIAKGHLTGLAKNGDGITFPENFSAVPLIIVDGGISYEPRAAQWSGTYSATLPQYVQREAVNVSVAGFTMRARLRQKGGATARSHNFGANTLTAAGHTIALTLANAPANNDTYTVHYSVSLIVTCTSGLETFAELVVAIDTMTDGSTWVQRTTRVYTESDIAGGSSTTLSISEAEVPVTVTGVDSTDQIRIRIVSLTVTGSPGFATCQVHGFDGTGDPDSGVTYETASDIFATMTPDTADYVSWHAIEVDA